MANRIGMAAQLAGGAARVGWYLAVNRVVAGRVRAVGGETDFQPTRPVPSRNELLRDLRNLLLRDARAVRDGVHAADVPEPMLFADHVSRLRAMLRDLPSTIERRRASEHDTVRSFVEGAHLPDYYAQDFHFQTGGHLSTDSAQLYDVQVDTLFYGSAGPMRRSALRLMHTHVSGRDQRRIALLDVACGTGRFLRDARLTYPAMTLAGLDLSPAYLDEARGHLDGLRRVEWIRGMAEAMPVPDASQDIVTCIYLFHELPPGVRRTVAREIARVLKPGGLFVLVDSLQFGDKPGWDGLLEAFPVRFHEPYYRHYLVDDLESLFADAGLAARDQELAFLSKAMSFGKPG